MSKERLSQDSLAEATANRARYSGHGKAKGEAGYVEDIHDDDGAFLSAPGQSIVIQPRDEGLGQIHIGAAWDNIVVENSSGLLGKLVKKATRQGVDIDLGCLYELKDGSRGCIQAFGEKMGSYNTAPFISLSGDERTGDAAGDDEFLQMNGNEWQHFKRVLIYAYIYDGASGWSDVRPQIRISVPGEPLMTITPATSKEHLTVCAIASLENVREGIRVTNHSEYFPGHPEMDRAFGFGIEWSDGRKD